MARTHRSSVPARALVVLAASQRALGQAADARATQAAAERLHPRDPGVRRTADMLTRDAGGAAP